MSRVILLLVGLMLVYSSPAQEWFPLGASWYYNQVILLEGETYRYFEVTGETIIQGKNCKVISGGCSCGIPGYDGYLYEEGDRVFSYDFVADTFRLLYDFNLVAGDTLNLYVDPSLGENGLFLIDSVTLIQLDTLQLRVQHITELTSNVGLGGKIIERIGSDGCLYPQITVCDPSTGGLRCYEDAEIGLINFQSPERPCNYQTSSSLEIHEKSVSIYPNPTTGILHFESDESIEQIEIFNSVLSLSYTYKTSDLLNNEINLVSFPPGLYFIRIATANYKILVERIVLQ